MAQIIKHRRGQLSAVKALTARNAEFIIASGSISDLNGPFVFIGSPNTTDEGVAGAFKSVSQLYQGTTAPSIAAGSYGSILDGTPFYASGNQSLYILNNDGAGGNSRLDLTGNIEGNLISGVTINNITGTTANITHISGSFTGSGMGLYNIPASGITGLELNRISDGAATASISALGGLKINTKTEITGALIVTGNITGSNMLLTGDAKIDGNITLGGNITIGDANTDVINFGGEVSSSIVPDVHNAFDLGSSSKNWRNLHVSGTAYINILEAQQVNFNDLGILTDLTVSGSTYLGNGGDITVVSGSLYNDQLTQGRFAIVGDNGLITDTGSFNYDGGQVGISGSIKLNDTAYIYNDGALVIEDTTNGILLNGGSGGLNISSSLGSWSFKEEGDVSFPIVQTNGRTGTGEGLLFKKSGYQKVISTENGTVSSQTVERMVIAGGDSYNDGGTYSGEGGDLYLWAGKGYDGGDIKIDAGEATDGTGGTIKVRGGYSPNGNGGFVEINAGDSSNAVGGNVNISAGTGTSNGVVNITSDTLLTGSLFATKIEGTGSLYLQPNQNDGRYFEIYNTSPSDTHIKASGGLSYFGDDTNYLKIDDSLSTVTIVGVNGVSVSSSLNVTGSIYTDDIFGRTVNSNGLRLNGGTFNAPDVELVSARQISLFSEGGSGADFAINMTGSVNITNDLGVSGSLTTNGLTNNGDLTVNGILTVTGNTQLQSNLYVSGNLEVLGSATNVNLQSNTVEIGDNIILLNAYSPFQQYAGISAYDSGSAGASGSLLWDSLNDYWMFVSSSGQSSKVIGTTAGTYGSEVSLTSGTFPIADGDNTIGDSLLTYSGTTLAFNTNKFTIDSDNGDTLVSGNFTLSYSGGTDNGTKTSGIMFRNSTNVVGFVSTTETTDVLDGILGYKHSDGGLTFSTVIDGGTY
jgi:hypothetical protein